MRKMKVLSVLIVFMLIVPLLFVTIGKSYEVKAAGNIDVGSLRGINHAHTWYADRLDEALQGIKSWGANSVRIVLSNGYRWTKNSPSDVANVISKCEQLGFTAIVLEV